MNGQRRSNHGKTGKTGAKKARVTYSADFETVTVAPTRVWLWGMVDIADPDNSELEWGIDIESFIERCQEHNSCVEFFNLKFDGHFILDWLLKNGYEHVEKDKKTQLARGQFETLISHTNKFYTMTVHWLNGHTTEFRDAAKKFPNMSVAVLAKVFNLDVSKGELDYHKERAVGYWPTDEELDYTDRDVRIVAKALRVVFDSGMTRLTVGADALAEYKSLTGVKNFRNVFPILNEDLDAEIRKAYRGGFTYCDERFKGKRQGNGIVLDVNSLYPHIMYTKPIPYGMPEYVQGKVNPTEQRPLTIFRVTFTAKLKPNHIPCIQIKGSSIFGSTEYLKEIEEPTSLMVTNVDWDLYNDHYDIEVYAYEGGYRFKAAVGLFKTYIDKWSKIKAESEGGQREIAKLHLNSLYGKFASNPNVTGKIPYLEEDRVRFAQGTPDTKEPVYTAAGVFITSFARDLTIRAAQESYPVFAYADTDSLHLLTDEIPDGLDVDDRRMGAWAFEYAFMEAHFVRAKVYLERKADGSFKTAFAGLPQGVAGKLTFEDLVEGKVIQGKLQPRSVVGGVVLENVPFTLNLTG